MKDLDIPVIPLRERPKIRAIETNYLGYRFRSRLEARWACFFNELDIRFEYEKEGFEWDGTKYLPDFWLPFTKKIKDLGFLKDGRWVEIKGKEPTEIELKKINALANGTGQNASLIVGYPGDFKHFYASHNGQSYWDSYEESPFGEEHDDIWNITMIFHPFLIGIENADYHIAEAILKAQQARFEFNEKG